MAMHNNKKTGRMFMLEVYFKVTMTWQWAFAILATTASYAYIWRKTRCIVFWSQTCVMLFLVLKLAGFYAPFVSRLQYGWMAWSGDLLTCALDCAVIFAIVYRTEFLAKATLQELVAAMLLALHQKLRIDWHWASDDLFHAPVGAFSYLVPIRDASNYACLLALVMLVSAQPRTGEFDETRRLRKAEAPSHAAR